MPNEPKAKSEPTHSAATTGTPTITSHEAIKVENLSHTYTSGQTGTTILNNVSFAVQPGQTVALIGRSGSGKSTLLNLISGLEPVQSGNVLIDGVLLSDLSDSQRTRLRGRSIGFIYQAFNLIPTLSVMDNVGLPLALANIPNKKQRKLVTTTLEDVGLATRGNDFPDQLSGGEQQRVAIARALVHRPALILADEPTGNLDAASGRKVLQLLRDLVSEQNSALLLVTHSNEVASVADQVLLLEQGEVNFMSSDDLGSSATW